MAAQCTVLVFRGVGYGGVGPGNLGSVYFGDTGTAVTTLAMCKGAIIARQPEGKCCCCSLLVVKCAQALVLRRKLIMQLDT